MFCVEARGENFFAEALFLLLFFRATHPDFQYQPIAAPEELGNYGRVKWISGRLGEVPAYSGTDFLIARDGRIADVIMFFDKPPELNSAV